MMANIKTMISVSDCLSVISDDKSLALFNAIALANTNSNILLSKFQLTRKQYYGRLSNLSNAGLIKRKNGRYLLTSFGELVYKAQELIGQAVQCSAKLKVIDPIDLSDFPTSERNKLVDTLITKNEIKKILMPVDLDTSHHSKNGEKIYSSGLTPTIATNY
jgi:predicted transcriptional regulator